MSKVWVLQHTPCETLGAIEDAIRQAGFQSHYVRGYEGDPIPTGPEGAAGLVVMGGPMGVYEQDRFPFLTHELRLIERTVAAGLPVLGVCLGSQLLATALGATVRKGKRKEIGWYRVFLESGASADSLFQAAPAEFDAFHWHGDIYDVPPGAVKLARSSLTGCQAFRHGAKVYGILFHMEVTAGLAACMREAFGEELSQENIDSSKFAQETEAKLPALQPIGAGVFSQWAKMLGAANARTV